LKKTYVTTMPDRVGAFLKASRCFSRLGINITRTSYNKSIDSQTLFIEVEGDEAKLHTAEAELMKIGYLHGEETKTRILLTEFQLRDVPGAVTDVLEIIHRYSFNISYISSSQNGTGFQLFKMGLLYDDEEKINKFLDEASALYSVRVINYNTRERSYDNSIFYNSFAGGLADLAGLDEKETRELIINTNLAMQAIDERGDSPFITFDCIRKFAEHICRYKGKSFEPRITWHTASEKVDIIVIEPACGSNTMILKSGNEYLFIDTGYACYEEEMLRLFKRILPDFDTAKKEALITHADVDHCGLLHLFDTVYMSRESFESLCDEADGKPGAREKNPLHLPYSKICKLITNARPLKADSASIISSYPKGCTDAVAEVGAFKFADLNFKIYQGAGGHVQGEIILHDEKNKIAFSGDVFINIKGLTPEQAEYNKYAPILMNAVDTDRSLAAMERDFVKKTMHGCKVFGSHGCPVVL